MPSDVPSPEDVLQKSQRNDLFCAIEKSGIPVTEFKLMGAKLVGAGKRVCVLIDHRRSLSYFGLEPILKGRRVFSDAWTMARS